MIDYGWHYNLTDFITNISKGEELKFPTKDVFLFVEKIPVGMNHKVTSANVTDFTLPARTEILDFYRLPEYRKMLHEKTWYWIEGVQEKHSKSINCLFRYRSIYCLSYRTRCIKSIRCFKIMEIGSGEEMSKGFKTVGNESNI